MSAIDVLTAHVREANPEQETVRAQLAPKIGRDPDRAGWSPRRWSSS